MSWDIVLFNSSQLISSVEEIDETMLVPTDLCSALENHFQNILKIDGNQRSVQGKGFEIDFFIDSEQVSNKMISLYGEQALYEIVILARQKGWQIFDTALGQMIDLNSPDKNGYESFNKYLQQVLNNKT